MSSLLIGVILLGWKWLRNREFRPDVGSAASSSTRAGDPDGRSTFVVSLQGSKPRVGWVNIGDYTTHIGIRMSYYKDTY